MTTKDPYKVILNRHVTEKAQVLQELKNNNSNPSVRRFLNPKYVFVVDPAANKRDIKNALEEIYKDQDIKVKSVNTINVKSQPRRRRGRSGRTASFRKAIVTLDEKDSLDNL